MTDQESHKEEIKLPYNSRRYNLWVWHLLPIFIGITRPCNNRLILGLSEVNLEKEFSIQKFKRTLYLINESIRTKFIFYNHGLANILRGFCITNPEERNDRPACWQAEDSLVQGIFWLYFCNPPPAPPLKIEGSFFHNLHLLTYI